MVGRFVTVWATREALLYLCKYIFPVHFLTFNFNFSVVKNVNFYAVNLPILSLVVLILVAWLRGSLQDFLGGPVVKSSPANAGDTGSIPGPGGFHLSQGNQACVPQLLSPWALESMLLNNRSHRKEKLRVVPARHN